MAKLPATKKTWRDSGHHGTNCRTESVSSTTDRTGEAAGESLLKVKSGLFGFGSEYYIPSGAVRDVTKDRVVLSVEKDKIERMDWGKRPPWISD